MTNQPKYNTQYHNSNMFLQVDKYAFVINIYSMY